MGAGIRPKGSFSYAALRYPDTRPACFNFRSTCPDRALCQDRCVHASECKGGT
jgi:hypothetical protein